MKVMGTYPWTLYLLSIELTILCNSYKSRKIHETYTLMVRAVLWLLGKEKAKHGKIGKLKMRCDDCFLKSHTKEEIFKLVGYPEWFNKPREKEKKIKCVTSK